MNTLTDLLLGVGQPRVSHFPDLCTLLYTYLSTLDYWTKIVYYLFTQTSPVAHTSALTPTYIKSHKLPNWPISKELGLGRMLLPHWKLLLFFFMKISVFWFWFHWSLLLRVQLTISALAKVMPWFQTGNTPLPQPLTTHLIATYMCHWVSVS